MPTSTSTAFSPLLSLATLHEWPKARQIKCGQSVLSTNATSAQMDTWHTAVREGKWLGLRLVNKLVRVEWQSECLSANIPTPNLHIRTITFTRAWRSPFLRVQSHLKQSLNSHVGEKAGEEKCDGVTTITPITLNKYPAMRSSCLICFVLPTLTFPHNV